MNLVRSAGHSVFRRSPSSSAWTLQRLPLILLNFVGCPKPYFSVPGPSTLFSDPGALQNRSGMCLNACVVFVSSNVHAGMLKIIVKSIEPSIWGFSTFVEVRLPALRGEHLFEKGTQNIDQSKYSISQNFNECRAEVIFSIHQCLV